MGTNDPEVHHAAPRCLISLHEKANGTTSLDREGIQAWLEWEAMRWCVPVEISRDELEALVERSTVVLEREKHRLIHQGDWRRWGSRAVGRHSGAMARAGLCCLPAGGGAALAWRSSRRRRFSGETGHSRRRRWEHGPDPHFKPPSDRV